VWGRSQAVPCLCLLVTHMLQVAPCAVTPGNALVCLTPAAPRPSPLPPVGGGCHRSGGGVPQQSGAAGADAVDWVLPVHAARAGGAGGRQGGKGPTLCILFALLVMA
jgi:hypothetical protein